MTAAWVIYALLVGTLLAAAAVGSEELCRLAGRPVRWVWAVALALTVGLAGVAPQRASPLRLTSPTESGAAAPAVASRDADGRGWMATVRDAMGRVRRAVAESTEGTIAWLGRHVPAAADRVLAAIWLSLSALLLALHALVHGRVLRLRGRWPVAWLHGIRVRVSPETGPAVVGLSRPEIVVPRWLFDRTADEQRLVLAHEREHVRARDPLLLTAAWLAAALIPWHPAVWWMAARLRLAVEIDCDARVLGQGVRRRPYGTLLIDLAGHCSGMRAGAPALAAPLSHLERRLLAMQPRHPRFAPARGTALAAFAALSLLAACEARLPTSAEVERMDVASAHTAGVRISLAKEGDSSSVYVLDDTVVSAARARALAPEQIAAIAVQRGPEPGAKTTVRITSRAAAGPEGAGLPPLPPLAGTRSSDTFTGIVLIDGVRSDFAAMNALAPADIRSVEVIKGPTASKLYPGPDAANGVIRITTGRGAASGSR